MTRLAPAFLLFAACGGGFEPPPLMESPPLPRQGPAVLYALWEVGLDVNRHVAIEWVNAPCLNDRPRSPEGQGCITASHDPLNDQVAITCQGCNVWDARVAYDLAHEVAHYITPDHGHYLFRPGGAVEAAAAKIRTLGVTP